jgi:hypothetical protein
MGGLQGPRCSASRLCLARSHLRSVSRQTSNAASDREPWYADHAVRLVRDGLGRLRGRFADDRYCGPRP